MSVDPCAATVQVMPYLRCNAVEFAIVLLLATNQLVCEECRSSCLCDGLGSSDNQESLLRSGEPYVLYLLGVTTLQHVANTALAIHSAYDRLTSTPCGSSWDASASAMHRDADSLTFVCCFSRLPVASESS